MSSLVEEDRQGGESQWPYRATLAGYGPGVLRGIRDHLEMRASARSSNQLAKAIEEHLRAEPNRAAALADWPSELRPALHVLPYIPPAGWRLEEARELLRYAGCPAPEKALRALLGLGFVAVHAPGWQAQTLRHFDLALDGWDGESLTVVPHPALAGSSSAPAFPRSRGLVHDVVGVRAADGLEFPLRVAVIWERIAQAPLRLTNESALFKRDKERLTSDPVLTAATFDELYPIEDIGYLALILGKHLRVLVPDAEGEVLRAHLGTVWQSGLPAIQRRIMQGLLGARHWTASNGDGTAPLEDSHVSAKRWAILLRLASLEPGAWIPLAELDRALSAREARPVADGEPRGPKPFKVVIGRNLNQSADEEPENEVSEWLQGFILGAMYQLGTVHVAEVLGEGSPVVQMSPLGRWLLGLGPQPPIPAVYEKSLVVQPNHEVIVYRQGLDPELIGQLASFCHWKSLGAALTLELTPESVYRGLELGRTAEEMISILERRSQRPVPPAVVDSIRTWSGRRERLRLYSQCTVLEFASAEDLDTALARGADGDRLSDRLLLVAGEGKIPFNQFRLAGARDYRQAPSVCVDTDDDGITWTVDLNRSDLIVERELARFAEPVAGVDGHRSRYRITSASLAAAARLGLRAGYVREWFKQRAGRELPPSVELMLEAGGRSGVALAHLVVLETSAAAVADGIMQHPATRQHVARRIGPTALAILPDRFDSLRKALEEMGIDVSNGVAQ